MSFAQSLSAHKRLMVKAHDSWKNTSFSSPNKKKFNERANYHAQVVTKMNSTGKKLSKEEKKKIFKSKLNY